MKRKVDGNKKYEDKKVNFFFFTLYLDELNIKMKKIGENSFFFFSFEWIEK